MSQPRRCWWAAVEACLVAIVLVFGTPQFISKAPAAPKAPRANLKSDDSSSLRNDLLGRAATAAVVTGGMVAFMAGGSAAAGHDIPIATLRMPHSATRHGRKLVQRMYASHPLASRGPNIRRNLATSAADNVNMLRFDTSAVSNTQRVQCSQ